MDIKIEDKNSILDCIPTEEIKIEPEEISPDQCILTNESPSIKHELNIGDNNNDDKIIPNNENSNDREPPDEIPKPVQLDRKLTRCQLPEKSKLQYEKTYTELIKWCKSSKIPLEKLHSEKNLLDYFLHMSKERKPSSLSSYYSMLKATIKANHNVDINSYLSLFEFLRKKSDGYKPKTTKIFSMEEIETFLYEAPDELYLMYKVALIFGLCGACRKQELVRLEIDDIQDLGTMLKVSLRDINKRQKRYFKVINNKRQPTWLDIYKKYVALRPPNTETRRFFLAYRNGRCVRQVVGKNVFGEIPKRIASYLRLPNPELYTGHSFRRSSTTVLDNKQLTGQLNLDSNDSDVIEDVDTSTMSISTSTRNITQNQKLTINMTNCSNCVINFNFE